MGDEKDEEVTAPTPKEESPADHVPPPPVVEDVKEMPQPEAPSAA